MGQNRFALLAAAMIFAGSSGLALAQTSTASNSPSLSASEQRDMGPGDDMGQQMGDRMRQTADMHDNWMSIMMRGMMGMPPKQRCEEALARHAGIVAYLVAKLNLNDQQKPLWDKLNTVLQANADRERQFCASMKPRTLLDRVNRREQFLSERLQGLQQAKPAIEQLYNSLTPEQKAVADHPFRRP